MEQSETKQISWEQFVSSANTLVRVSETTEPEMWCRRTYSVSVTPLGINMKHTEHTKKKAHTHLCMGWISFVSMLNSASTRQNRFCSAGYLDSDSVVWASLSLCVFQALFFFSPSLARRQTRPGGSQPPPTASPCSRHWACVSIPHSYVYCSLLHSVCWCCRCLLCFTSTALYVLSGEFKQASEPRTARPFDRSNSGWG